MLNVPANITPPPPTSLFNATSTVCRKIASSKNRCAIAFSAKPSMSTFDTPLASSRGSPKHAHPLHF
ncbi:uncharacterized protein BJX67DRAFT_310460 [Aspergillus lucknowensis]|uniref:Uncharacterized protein n=1 Tax=Aspergillus lucknowensis TaxID=176173 RepID=A0ABR4LCG1_9EURO